MVSSLAAQLSKIAAESTKSLDLKAQKASHSKSLIFEPRVAASQTFDSLYILCQEGFRELCVLDHRYLDYQGSLFSEQSQEIDRTQLTVAENTDLDRKLESFLGLVGGRLRLNPAIKAVEWLVRRFRIHEYNTAFILTTFLPYHTLPIFTTLLSILPSSIPHSYKFLHPYIRSLTQLPRHVIIHNATNDPTFTSLLNTYVLKISNERHHYQALLSFWAGVMSEAVSGMLDKSKSGRRGVQLQNGQDVILRLLPVLNEGLAMRKVSELRIGCYMVLSIMASKGGLNDKLLTAMMEAVVLGWTRDTFLPGLVCLSILAQHRGAKQITRRLTKELLKVDGLPQLLVDISKHRQIDKLANGLCLALIDRLIKTGDGKVLMLVEHILQQGFLSNAQIIVVTKALILAAHRFDNNNDPESSARRHLAKVLVVLASDPGHSGAIVRKAMQDSTIDMDELEMKLQVNIRLKELSISPAEDVTIEESQDGVPTELETFGKMLSRLPMKSVDEVSFLSHNKSHIYEQLCLTFLASFDSPAHLVQFQGAPVLRRDLAEDDTLFFSFCMRIWCGPYPVLARVSALRMMDHRLKETEIQLVDFQGVLPYAVVALSDASVKVRRAAADLIATLQKLSPVEAVAKKESAGIKKWGSANIYGPGEQTESVEWLLSEYTIRILRDVLSPALEECVLDKNHINAVFDKTLNSSNNTAQSSKKTDSIKISHSLRISMLSFFASHAVSTPIYLAKLRLLAVLNNVRRVTNITRTKVLLPILQQWAQLTSLQVQQLIVAEKLDVIEFDDEAVKAVVENDAPGLDYLASIIKGKVAGTRDSLKAAVFRRLRKMWPSLKGDTRIDTAQLLMDVSQWPAGVPGADISIQGEAMDLLQSVTLSTDVLLSFINQLPTAAKLADAPSATKRRRVSHGEVARTNLYDSRALPEAIQKVTFVLQLIDSSNPENHIPLLRGLFNTLAELQHFKTQVGSELGYLQSLVLSSLLSIMGAYKKDKSLKLDRAAVRADLLVDCVQKTGSPQVQNAALLLIASLAETAPELILHSVMPIFTFMGSSVLRQNDEYSAQVIKQTIEEVIPPLIASLRKEKVNPVIGAAELLLSFVAAYEHVPAHRKQRLFILLVQTLGAEDFLFALLAMLADKYGATENTKTFAGEVYGSFGVDIQLQTAVNYLDLVQDVLKPKSTIASTLLSSGDQGTMDPQRTALKQLNLLPYLLSQKRLITQTGRLLQRDDMDASRVRDLYSSLLETLLTLADIVKGEKRLHAACGDVLESILGLLSTSEFVKSVESLLDRSNEDLRRKILRSLESRITQESQSDPSSRQAMLNFLPQLTAIIRDSHDILYKHTAIACVDKISEKYGKKDIEAVAAAAQTIASEHCLGQTDERLQVMALLCLASLVEVLREGIVSVLPDAISKALEYMVKSVRDDEQDTKLHNAGYSFISALVHHLPYMISGANLATLLAVSNMSAEAELDEEADESRIQCLQLVAKQVEAKSIFEALNGNWNHAADAGPRALREYLGIMNTAIDKHTKTIITKQSPVLSSIFLKAFDLRRQSVMKSHEYISDDEMEDIEGMINEVAIKMIYKLNDSTFRPIFTKVVEWAAATVRDNDTDGRILRLQSVYAFMVVFFGDLKSIVTSYSTYLLDNAVEVLKTVNLKNEKSIELWTRVLRTLVECFKHDQDDFWQSPAHFDLVSGVLTSQFLHASYLPVIAELVPAIVELAAAADSAEHHKDLNMGVLKLMRSEDPSVRLAAVKCEQGLTDRLGEEWMSLLPEMLPFISELQEDDDEAVEKETHRWIIKIEGVLGESLDSMLQ